MPAHGVDVSGFFKRRKAAAEKKEQETLDKAVNAFRANEARGHCLRDNLEAVLKLNKKPR